MTKSSAIFVTEERTSISARRKRGDTHYLFFGSVHIGPSSHCTLSTVSWQRLMTFSHLGDGSLSKIFAFAVRLKANQTPWCIDDLQFGVPRSRDCSPQRLKRETGKNQIVMMVKRLTEQGDSVGFADRSNRYLRYRKGQALVNPSCKSGEGKYSGARDRNRTGTLPLG